MNGLDEKIKSEMSEYWGTRAEKFNELKVEELKSDLGQMWLTEIQKFLPNEKSLKILDIGTGTGFFCFLLSKIGHDMTGIDLTEDMIIEAKNTSELLKIPAKFYVMDAESPQFEKESFDVIVTRNVTWTLPNLEKAYKNWYPLLKKSGVLINFDADYCREESLVEIPENHAHTEITKEQWGIYENMKNELRSLTNTRPKWDIELLKNAGFKDIIIDTEVGSRIYTKKDKFYNPTPVFVIVAKKY